MRNLGHLVAGTHVGGVTTVIEGLLEAGSDAGATDRLVVARTDAGRGHTWTRSRCDLLRDIEGLDALVVHGVFSAPMAWATALIRRGCPELPLVAMPHDGYDDGLFSQRPLVKAGYFALVERPHLRACRTIVTTAPSHEKWLRQRGVHTPVLQVPLGLCSTDLSKARASYSQRTRRTAEPFRLLVLGRWDVHEKGIDLAVTAAAECASDVHLRLVGPASGQEARVRDLARRAGSRVEVVGFVSDVWQELRNADLLLMPSRKEGFGIAALQALAAGTPVLLSSRAGFAEHLGTQEGMLSAAPDPAGVRAGLAEALERLPQLSEDAGRFARERAAGWTYAPLRAALDQALDLPS